MRQNESYEELHTQEVHPSSHRRPWRGLLIILALLLFTLTAKMGLPFLHGNTSPHSHNWVSFHLRGTGRSPFAASGARVTVTAGDRSWVKWVESPDGDVPPSDRPLTFDVGSLTHIDRVEIFWPDERVERLTRVSIDTSYEIREGEVLQ